MSLYFSTQTDKLIKLKYSASSEAAKEAAAALRAQLQSELQNIKQCTYKAYECTQLTLEGYNYCLRHILQDKNAPYKQCAFIYNTNGKRCYLPAPKDKKDTGYCNEHALKTNLASSKRGTRYQPPRTAEFLLHSLSHYIKKPRTRTLSSSTQYSDEDRNTPEESGVTTKSLDPFVDIDANTMLASGSEVLDMCSESESDVEATSYGSVWHDAHAESSDNESLDSEQEDVLKHANVYSAEEITLITRDKLIRLQALYIDQFRYLQHMLRERRRRYLYALKREKETCCSITNQIHDNPKEQRMYKKLKAYNSYHKKHGVDAICNKRLHERRLKVTEGIAPKPHSYSKCIFTEGGVKCGERALPVTKHCRKHILEDPNQVLFRACSKVRGDMECTTPVEAIFDDTTCRLHMDIPPIRSYTQVRKDSESDYDDSMEANMSTLSTTVEDPTSSQNSNVKTEIINFGADANSMDAIDMKQEIKEEPTPTENIANKDSFASDAEMKPSLLTSIETEMDVTDDNVESNSKDKTQLDEDISETANTKIDIPTDTANAVEKSIDDVIGDANTVEVSPLKISPESEESKTDAGEEDKIESDEVDKLDGKTSNAELTKLSCEEEDKMDID